MLRAEAVIFASPKPVSDQPNRNDNGGVDSELSIFWSSAEKPDATHRNVGSELSTNANDPEPT